MHFSIITKYFEIILISQNIKRNRPMNTGNQACGGAVFNSYELKNVNLLFLKRRSKEQFMSANAYSVLYTGLIFTRPSLGRSHLFLGRPTWISDFCVMVLYNLLSRDKTLDFHNHFRVFFLSSPQYFCQIRQIRLKLPSQTSTFQMFRMYYFIIFA